MIGAANDAAVYTDFSALAELRGRARADADGAVRKVAEQFEALFLQMMLKSMRQASFGDPMFDSNEAELYREMFDQQVALSMAQGRGIGLAEVIERQLRASGIGETAPGDPRLSERALRIPPPALVMPPVRMSQTAPQTEIAEPSAVQHEPAADNTPGFSGAADFLSTLRPWAEQAAARLGTRPEVLLAQAALETGWGRHVVRGKDGVVSHNLFNIKADSRWSGERVVVPTLEYEDGIAVRRMASFRAYGSYRDSFDDYVDFLQTSPRYAVALEQAGHPGAFVRALHEAGYATDPDYAHKVLRVYEGLRAAVAAGQDPGAMGLKAEDARDAMANEDASRS